MEFIAAPLSSYAERFSSPETDLLHKINRETHLEVRMPRMLSGHLQGRFLAMVSHMCAPTYIVELGTYTGYATLCLAEGLTSGGTIVTVDNNRELTDRVKRYFNESPYAQQIDYRCGNALDIVPTLQGGIDLAFIDADKQNYLTYYRMLLPKMKTGGILLADNVLWSGKVTDGIALRQDKDTAAIHAFNEAVRLDTTVSCMLLPLRDGIMMIRKK
jgi:predicted O-methyltransferase YrrM